MKGKIIKINGVQMVKVQTVYDSIREHYGWDSRLNKDSKDRLLRLKLSFLLKNIVLRRTEDFKNRGNAVLPINDAAIVRNLLIEAVNDDGENMIYDWFNGNVDTSDSQQALPLYMQIKPVVMEALMTGETDEVTVVEWLNTISAVINHTTAANTLAIKRALEDFRNDSLGMDMKIDIGDIIVGCEDGSRFYYSTGKKPDLSIDDKAIDAMLAEVTSQDDYFSILFQILRKFDEHVKTNVRSTIIDLAAAVDAFDASNMRDAVFSDSMASEYLIWYHRLHTYLKANKEVCDELEKETGIDHLADLFDVTGRGKYNDETTK